MSSFRCQRVEYRQWRMMGKKRAEQGYRQHLVFSFERELCLGRL